LPLPGIEHGLPSCPVHSQTLYWLSYPSSCQNTMWHNNAEDYSLYSHCCGNLILYILKHIFGKLRFLGISPNVFNTLFISRFKCKTWIVHSDVCIHFIWLCTHMAWSE
jgi:hypothetical protein